MSKSRLEKFLYALYSLDSSDLPTPLSRIEELYKCWVTGEEAPSFEPISRVEKYLMAILGAYDVDSLPNPLSRVEVLLYKLATGDDNLDDVKSFLSEHEELLVEIIRNGGVGGNIDIEYVLYTLSTEFNTLYNTAEKPVKSAFLKGQTLVNHFPPFNPTYWEARNGSIMHDGYVILKANDAADFRPKPGYRNYPTLKPSTQYTYIYYVSENVGNVSIGATSGFPFVCNHTGLGVGLHKILVTTPEEIRGDYISQWFLIYADDRENGYAKITMMMLIEGDWTNTELPFKEHFDGMQSVKMPVLTTTSHEPFKSNILTTNEEVTLRGIGEVKDELNCLTGELTERIGEIMLDETSELSLHKRFSEQGCVSVRLNLDKPLKVSQPLLCDKLPYVTFNDLYNKGVNGVATNSSQSQIIYICVSVDDPANCTLSDVKRQILANPLTIQYQLATDSVKTVDLSVVDQDGNDTELKTFNDITHVTLSSEGLISEAELEVATKNEEDLEDTSVYTVHTLSEEFNTLYNTAEKPVKSAILKGQTSVNVNRSNYTANTNITTDYGQAIEFYDADMLPNTTYTIIMYSDNPYECRFSQMYNDREYALGVVKAGTPFVFTTVGNYQGLRSYLKGDELNIPQGTEIKILIIEGDYTNIDIPYFEGMQSVKMPVLKATGKNLFDLELIQGGHGYGVAGIKPDFNGSNNRVTNLTGTYIKVNPNTKITFSILNNIDFAIAELDINGYSLGDTGWVGYTTIKPNHTITTKEKTSYIGFNFRKFDNSNITVQEVLDSNPMLEISGTATTYEPYKSNILTVNEDVELRGIGDVKDKLDLMTGELTQRIGEVVLDGSQDGSYDYVTDVSLDLLTIRLPKIPNMTSTGSNIYGLPSDKYVSVTKRTPGNIYSYNGRIMLAKSLSELESFDTPDKIKLFLSQNPITVQYPLATPIIKTVDLSVVDQDGNNTELKTFNDITHVTLSSEGLIPEAELEVAEKVPEVAASMLTISREQEVINATTNEQSENVDATMIATTEIYEELL